MQAVLYHKTLVLVLVTKIALLVIHSFKGKFTEEHNHKADSYFVFVIHVLAFSNKH